DHRLHHHHDHAEDRQHKFRQDPHVVSTLRDGLHDLCEEGHHWPTALLAICATGVNTCCTAGSIAPSQISGATPMTRATTAPGQSAAFSKPVRSGNVLFSSC